MTTDPAYHTMTRVSTVRLDRSSPTRWMTFVTMGATSVTGVPDGRDTQTDQ